ALEGRLVLGSLPGGPWWDVHGWKGLGLELAFPNQLTNPLIALFDYGLVHLMHHPVFDFDHGPAAGPIPVGWKGNAGEVAWFIWGYESLWLPASLLENNRQERLADALFAGSRSHPLALHFNKGLAGAPPEAIAAAKDTAMNPAVLTAFALVIAADGQGP